MKVIVTGCRGFVGGLAGAHAAAHSHEVLGIGRSSQAPLGWSGEYLQADVAEAALGSIIREWRPDLIFHGAGSASVANSIERPLDDLRASVISFANVLDGVRDSGLKPVILFPSSAAVYGNPSSLPVSESALANPISPYGFHKQAAELIAREYAHCHDLSIVIGRLFSVFGPTQRRLLVWELFAKAMSDSSELVLGGTGMETRDYLPGSVVVQRLFDLAEAARDSGPGVLAVNIASGCETSVRDLTELVMELTGRHKPIKTAQTGRAGDPSRWVADVSSLENLTGPLNLPPLRDLLADCIRQWQSGASII